MALGGGIQVNSVAFPFTVVYHIIRWRNRSTASLDLNYIQFKSCLLIAKDLKLVIITKHKWRLGTRVFLKFASSFEIKVAAVCSVDTQTTP